MSNSDMGAYLIAACLFLVACSTVATKGIPDFSTTEARLEAAEKVANPEAKVQIEAARKQLSAAKDLCVANTKQLEDAVRERNESEAKISYWKAKQRKALKELWIYRGAIIGLLLWTFRGFIFNGVMFVARKFIGVPW